MLSNIRIVLVEPSHPGNIGAAARAMKNMCLEHLYLVSPEKYPHVDASARAAGADDVLDAAVVLEVANWYYALGVLALLIPALVVGQWISST